MNEEKRKVKLKHGSLFSGIGGFDLAAEWMGWENLFHCEWNDFGQRVLKYYWPDAEGFTDITKTDFTKYANKIDILTGGFPCQPYSAAGKRLGKEDDRHLWPEMLRAIREISPRWVLGENVRGLVNWNEGMVFDEVQADLEAEGYEVQPFILPACAVNAPHRRDRVWFVAFNTNSTASGKKRDMGGKNGGGISQAIKKGVFQETHDKCTGFCEIPSNERSTSNTDSSGNTQQREGAKSKGQAGKSEKQGERGQYSEQPNELYGFQQPTPNTQRIRSPREEHRKAGSRFDTKKNKGCRWQNFPTQSPICSRNDGISPKLDGITFPKWRNESIKAYGNAIVPQVAYQIFKVIGMMENQEQNI